MSSPFTSFPLSWAGPISISEQKEIDGLRFPLVLTPTNISITTSQLYEEIHRSLADLLHLQLQYGAIYFRDFPLFSASDFNDFVNSFKFEHLPYIGGAAVRKSVVGNVYTTNESPPDQLIPFHHEMAQVPNHPKKLFFFCQRAAEEGGQTPILLSNAVYHRALKAYPKFIADLEEKGVRYVRYLPENDDPSSAIGRGWKSTYLCSTKEEAESKCIAQGGSFEWQYDEWDGSNSYNVMKTVTGKLAAIRSDDRTGKKVFFNSIIAAYKGWKDRRNDNEKAVVFADGTPLDVDAIKGIAQIMDELAVSIRWKAGDCMFLDNITVMHSRNHFKGDRSIYAALIKS